MLSIVRATLAALTVTLYLASQTHASNRIIIFIQEVTRREAVLRKDGEVIDKFLASAKPGDSVLGFSTNGDEIFAYELDPGETNRLHIRSQYKKERAMISAFFVDLFTEPPEDAVNDVAYALRQAIAWCNSAPAVERISIVLLTSGLYYDGELDFRGAYPSFSWVAHPLSPFAVIPRNTTTAHVEALIIADKVDYVNPYHSRKIEDWYKVMLHHYGIQLSSFSTNHRTSSRILSRDFRAVPPPPEVDLTGDPELVGLSRLVEDEE